MPDMTAVRSENELPVIVGAEDHVVPLGQYAQPDDLARLGDFIGLSEVAARDMKALPRSVRPRITTGRTATSAGNKTT
jgi:hypothetical protein